MKNNVFVSNINLELIRGICSFTLVHFKLFVKTCFVGYPQKKGNIETNYEKSVYSINNLFFL